jgi:hypothetical protein
MRLQNKNPAAPSRGATGPGCSLLGGENTPDSSQINRPSQAPICGDPLPSFFELASENAHLCLQKASLAAQACEIFRLLGDYTAYVSSGEKFLEQCREFAKIKTSSIRNHETADRLENEALALRESADLLEFEARGHRDAASEAQTAERQAGLEKMAASSQGGAP